MIHHDSEEMQCQKDNAACYGVKSTGAMLKHGLASDFLR